MSSLFLIDFLPVQSVGEGGEGVPDEEPEVGLVPHHPGVGQLQLT